MPYCTALDLTDRFSAAELIQLTDRNNIGSIDYTVLDQAIADATAEINGYLTAYLPLVSVPANLVRIGCDVARYYLYDDAVTEQVQTRYDQAIKYLSQVAKGQISIGPDVTGTIATSPNDSVEFVSVTPIFGRDGGGY